MRKYVEDPPKDGIRKIDDNKYIVTSNGYTHIFDRDGLDEWSRIVYGRIMHGIEEGL